ncbi:hypothetical protein CHUAL_005406 [Chamberlinius hualienensis]
MSHKSLTSVILMYCMLFVIGVLAHQNRAGQQAFGVNSQHVHGNQQQFQGQQQQQQQPAQHQQQGQPHGHHGGGHQQQGVFDRQQVQDREHIKEHLDGIAKADTSTMTEQELQFHYFKMHDSDNNNKLDGSELIKSLIHWHVTEENHPNNPNRPPEGPKIFTDNELEVLIDPILSSDDSNRDGYIDYSEFAAAQARMATAPPQQPPQRH